MLYPALVRTFVLLVSSSLQTALCHCFGIALQSFRSSGACLLIRINGDAYAYSGDSERFARVPRMPVDLPDQLELALHQLDSIDRGIDIMIMQVYLTALLQSAT